MRGVIIIIALLLSACATDQPANAWTKQDSLRDDLAVDLYVCERWSRLSESPRSVHMPYLRDCMTSRGWQETAAK